ncbi:MAG: SGNH/GDSL hydrolase family protein [Bdellovibrio sp.]|nr:SGNH/GDSL hydrolase family protein [Bdellovibrio sp.]
MKTLLHVFILVIASFEVWAASGGAPPCRRVLFIGDSHSYGKFGEEVDKYLRTISTDVTSMASCGSSPSTWMASSDNYQSTNCGYWQRDSKGRDTRVKKHKVNSFPEELQRLEPDFTVVALGTNILGSKENIQRELPIVQQMLNEIAKSKSQCVWVGPPDLAKNPFKANLAEGNKALKKLVQKNNCIYVDSTTLTKYQEGTSDGLHYGPKDSAKWGIAVAKKIEDSRKVAEAANRQEQGLYEGSNPLKTIK